MYARLDRHRRLVVVLALTACGDDAWQRDDTSPTVNFTITVAAVNDTPSFVVGPTQDVLKEYETYMRK